MKRLIPILILSFLAIACTGHVGVRGSMGDLSALADGSTFVLQAQRPDYREVEPLQGDENRVVAAALVDALTARGLREADAETADYLVQYTAYQRDRYRFIFPEDFWTQEYYVIQTSSMAERRMNPKVGFLHLQIIDLESGSVVWQGVAEKVAGPNVAGTDRRLREGVGLLLANGSY